MPIDFTHHEDAPELPPPPADWWEHPPQDVETALYYLQTRAFKLTSDDEEGEVLRGLYEIVEKAYNLTQDEIKRQYPLAFFKPSYEQSLLLNAWIWGIDFPVCFSANRIGKTTSLCVINPCLWIFPNNPDWEMFHPLKSPDVSTEGATFVDNPHEADRYYCDLLGRKIQLLQRPHISALDDIRAVLKAHPELVGDPQISHLDVESGNAQKFARLQQLAPRAFTPIWPSASIQESGTIWLGAPDQSFHRDIILKEWKTWLPAYSIVKWSDSELFFHVRTTEEVNQKETTFVFTCKSYESEDTKWSGSAVTAIILTEGFAPSVLNEIRQRIKKHGFASWDYTPYEARNVGQKTALAFKVYKGTEPLPLTAHIFTRFSARNAPAHILPTSKRDDLVRMWAGKKEGDARLDGIFYSTSPLILSRLDRMFHFVPWTLAELQDRYPSGQHYRGFDPGYDHPTVCAWAYLVPGNIWFFYQYYVERQKTIPERCRDIINLSGNYQRKQRWGSGVDDFTLEEVHPFPHSTPIVLTATDFHIFKTDENTGQPYSLNYLKSGLNIVESTHMRPEDRALEIDRQLDRSNYHVHPVTQRSPGCKVYFLTNGPGVDMAVGKMEGLFWDRLASGPNKGEAKDTVPTHKDDELDATCYLVCGPYAWTNYQPERKMHYIENDNRILDPYTGQLATERW